jgi:hypothetical protein
MKQAAKRAGFLLGLLLDPEDGGSIFLRNLDGLQWAIQRYISENKTHASYCCENFKFNTN